MHYPTISTMRSAERILMHASAEKTRTFQQWLGHDCARINVEINTKG